MRFSSTNLTETSSIHNTDIIFVNFLLCMMRFAVVLLALVAVCLASSCPSWKMYKQCDEEWGKFVVAICRFLNSFFVSAQLGSSSSQTICTAGCAMSCVAMAMASYNEKINNALTNPGNLNDWLINNNGYANTDLIIWSGKYFSAIRLCPVS